MLLGPALAAHPATRTLGTESFDSSMFVWFVAWWPHALLAGLDPLHTAFLFAPGGYNLMWATSVPALSVAAAPITLLTGPVLAYNALALAAPVVSASAGFVLCRYLTGAFAPSLAGGAVFGFSPFLMANEQASALNLMYTALLPLAVWLVLRRLDERLSPRAFTLSFALLLTAQFLISEELLATFTAFGAATLLGVFLVGRPGRRGTRSLRGLLGPLVSAYGLCAVLLSPILYAMFARPHLAPAFGSTKPFSNDLLSLFVPSTPTIGSGAFASLAGQFPGGPLPGQHGFAYLGLPLLIVVALALFPGLRRLTPDFRIRFAAVLGAATLIASLGPSLHVAGHTTITLPWALATHLPLLKYALPSRLAIFTVLAAAAILAMWLAAHPDRVRWGLAALALVFLIPDPARFGHRLQEPTAYRDGSVARLLHANDIVFAIPPFGDSMRWQAETGMAYRLAGGYAGTFPLDYLELYCELGRPRPSTLVFERFLNTHHVTAILLPSRYEPYLRRLDPRARTFIHVGDQTVAPVAASRPAPRVSSSSRGGSLSLCR